MSAASTAPSDTALLGFARDAATRDYAP